MVTPYIIFLMVYVKIGRWIFFEEVQEMVKHGNAKKKLGCSWIMANN